MVIPFGNLQKNYLATKPALDKAIVRVLKSGWFILGEEVKKFEKEFAHYTKTRYCIGVANGLEAIQIALLSAGVRPGDEVITTPLSAAATSLAIVHVGARPVYVDIDPLNYNLDPKKILPAITKKTRAILPVHLYGQMTDMVSLVKIAREQRLLLIEDCAQAHGAAINGGPAGSWGIGGAFSFYPSKNMGAYGDAGCLVMSNKKMAILARAFRDYGQSNKYYHQYLGFNSRLDELQAAILRVKMRFLKKWNLRRRKIAALYTELLSSTPLLLPHANSVHSHVWHLYVVRTKKRDSLQRFLVRQGVATQVHYPKVLYQQPALRQFNRHQCPLAEKAVSEIISLPIYPEMNDDEVIYICSVINKFFKYGR